MDISASNDFLATKRSKLITYVLMGIGVISMIFGLMDSHDGTNRFFSNMLINGFFFFGISLGALFFLALQYATEAAWATYVKRVFEAIMAFIPWGAGALVIVFLAATFDSHHSIYHWMHHGITDPADPHYDSIIAGKAAYLNKPFWWIRTLVYLATFIVGQRFFRKMSIKQDLGADTKLHFFTFRRAALFLVFFAVFSSTLAWDWLMSLDPHWFSTLYGWYVFSGMWVTAMIMAIIFTLYLHSKGYLPELNKSHVHDLGKWMFAISFLWSYLWFSQFMLIWYSDIPEEVAYFMERIENYKLAFFGMFFINFAFPMLILMSRDAKRNPKFLITIGLIILCGHWIDVYLLVMPSQMHDHWHGIAWHEVGMALGYLGLFLFVVMKALAAQPLVVKNHPFMEESKHHSI